MSNETNEQVTVSADYFAKLHWMAKNHEMAVSTINSLLKQRDELKAKLKDCEVKHQDALALADRLAAAERCIEDIEKVDDMPYVVHDIIRAWRENKIISAWRENKEAK